MDQSSSLAGILATLSRPQAFSLPQPRKVLAEDVRKLQGMFLIAEDGPAVTQRLLDLLEAHPIGGKQIHDANIVATMLARGIHTILTNNADDYARYSRIVDVLSLASVR